MVEGEGMVREFPRPHASGIALGGNNVLPCRGFGGGNLYLRHTKLISFTLEGVSVYNIIKEL